MKRILLGVAATVVAAGSAFAAEMPLKAPPAPPPVWGWTGLYMGFNVGGHWGDDKITYAADPLGWDTIAPNAAAQIDALSAVTLKPKGPVGGFQIGYNWQTANVVVGIEADADEESGQGVRTLTYPATAPNAGDVTTNGIENHWLETLRARLGVTGWGPSDDPNRYLIYVTGGGALGTVHMSDTYCALGCPPAAVVIPPGTNLTGTDVNRTRGGWTAGAGIEDHLGSLGNINVTAKLEYLYVDLGSFSTVIPACSNVNCVPNTDILVKHRVTDNIVRVGLNVFWGAPAVIH